MFGGIVETIGCITQLTTSHDCVHLTIAPKEAPTKNFNDVNIGDSIAVNGVCLTVTHIIDNTFSFTAVPQTLRLTNLGNLIVGSRVNLERSLQVNSRLGGHQVQGHIDGVGDILEMKADGEEALLVKISVPSTLAKYVVNKGYIGLDGMSITVIEAGATWFTVTFIPHTQQVTIVNEYKVGTKINIEVDVLGKYIERYMERFRAVG